jgi:hypothetical protein
MLYLITHAENGNTALGSSLQASLNSSPFPAMQCCTVMRRRFESSGRQGCVGDLKAVAGRVVEHNALLHLNVPLVFAFFCT